MKFPTAHFVKNETEHHDSILELSKCTSQFLYLFVNRLQIIHLG